MILDIKEAAKFLRISVRSVERLLDKDELPTVEYPGVRRVLFDSEELEKWQKSCRKAVPAKVPTIRRFVSVLGGTRGRYR